VGLGLTTFFLLPLLIVRARWAAFPTTFGALLFVVGSTYLLLCGATRKSFGATVGALAGVALSGLLAMGVGRACGLSGLHDADLMAMYRFTTARQLDFRGILVAGMLLGTVGVVMDVAIATASAVCELRQAAPALHRDELRKRGLSVGRKVMGTMIMTLELAYMGANYGLFLLPYAEPGNRMADIFVNERIVAEAFRLLVGAIAVVWTIPVTAHVTAWLACRPADR